MRPELRALIFVTISAIFDQSEAQQWTKVPAEVERVPYASAEYLVTAAMDRGRIPVVLFNPAELSEISNELAEWILLREELIAILAGEILLSGASDPANLAKSKRGFDYPSTGRYLIIGEETIYANPQLSTLDSTGLTPAARLSCLSFLKLSTEARTKALAQYEKLTASGKWLTFGSPGRAKTIQSLRSEMRKCASDPDSKK